MFNRTYNAQPKEDVLGGLLLAASICWTVAAMAFSPTSDAGNEAQLARQNAAPVAIVKADLADRVAISNATIEQRATA